MTELTVHVFSEGPKRKCLFSMKERTVVEDGVTTIRPCRKGEPGSTLKEQDKAFAEFRAAIEADGLFPLDTTAIYSDGVTEFEIDLSSHNRSL